MKKIFIASDHAAFKEKQKVIEHLTQYEVVDLGTNSEESCNYSNFAISLAKKVQVENESLGILICGSGIGVSMAANRFQNVRAARCLSLNDAEMTRKHNDANVICLGSRVNSIKDILEMIDTFIKTKFEGGRHLERVNTFNNLGQSK